MRSFTCTALLGIPSDLIRLCVPGYHGLWPTFPSRSAYLHNIVVRVPLPRRDESRWFGLFRFRSPLLTESLCFLFLGLLRCFTSPRVALTDYEFIRQFL